MPALAQAEAEPPGTANDTAAGPGEAASEPAGPVVPEPVVVPRPPFERFVADELAGAGQKGKPRLVQVSKKRNEITDEERWFRDIGVTLPVSQDAPEGLALFRGVPLLARIEGDPAVLVYQTLDGPEAHVVGVDPGTGEARFAFDLSSFRTPPAAAEGAESLVAMEIRWAVAQDDRLYVSHAHRTYAESSRGANAYVTAIRIADGALLWRSQPLVSNAQNFALVPAGEGGQVLITGYGFTAEPDFLYVLDPETGAVLSKAKVDSGPEYIFAQGDRIHVRTYDRDYVFRMQP
jgi:PQQ-like domain